MTTISSYFSNNLRLSSFVLFEVSNVRNIYDKHMSIYSPDVKELIGMTCPKLVDCNHGPRLGTLWRRPWWAAVSSTLPIASLPTKSLGFRLVFPEISSKTKDQKIIVSDSVGIFKFTWHFIESCRRFCVLDYLGVFAAKSFPCPVSKTHGLESGTDKKNRALDICLISKAIFPELS